MNHSPSVILELEIGLDILIDCLCHYSFQPGDKEDHAGVVKSSSIQH